MKFLLLFIFISSQIFSQWLLPPYEVKTEPFQSGEKIIGDAWDEVDFQGDGEPEIVSLTRGCKIRPQIKLYSKGELIDSFNGSSITDNFFCNFTLHSPTGNDYLLFLHSYEHTYSLKMFFYENSKFKLKSIYEFNVGNKFPRGCVNYFKVPHKNLLFIYFNTEFPGKNTLRRIILLDTKNFKVLWEKLSIDYCKDIFYCKQDTNSIYYTTLAYTNGLFRSNNAFYSWDGDEVFKIDTSFIDSPPPRPDIYANDFATDTMSYVVKISLTDGKEIKRIKTGNSYFQTRVMKTLVDSLQYIEIFNRREAESTLYAFNTKTDSLIEMDNSLIKHAINKFVSERDIYFVFEKYIVNKNRNITNIFSVNGLKFKKIKTFNIDINGFANSDSKLKKRYAFILTKNLVGFILDTNLNIVADFSYKNLPPPSFFKRFHSINKIVAVYLDNNNISKELYFVKRPFYARLSPEITNVLFYVLLIVVGIILILWLTTMKIAYKKLDRKSKELEQATVQLINSEKLSLLGTIAASFAHQLNSPLGAIINSAGRLKKNLTENENLNLIKRSAEYSKTLVQKFLETSRYDVSSEKVCVKFNAVWEDWFLLFKNESLKRQIELTAELNHDDKEIKLKKSELFEILTNLMFNARDAILEANKETKQIYVSTKTENNNFILTVEDTGTGFNKKIIDKIYEPFVTTKEEGKGTGLGMWIVKNIITNAGGEIEISNTEKGAKVTIKIPYC